MLDPKLPSLPSIDLRFGDRVTKKTRALETRKTDSLVFFIIYLILKIRRYPLSLRIFVLAMQLLKKIEEISVKQRGFLV